MAFVLGFWNVCDALAITQYGDEVQRSHSIPVQMRVGLSAREVHEWRNRRSCGRSAHNVLLLGPPRAGTSML